MCYRRRRQPARSRGGRDLARARPELLLERASSNTFTICSVGGWAWPWASRRAGGYRPPGHAIGPIPSRAALLLHCCSCCSARGLGGSVGSSSPGAAARTRWWSQASRIGPRAGVRASVVERVDGPTLTSFVEGAGALATACRRTAATLGSARLTDLDDLTDRAVRSRRSIEEARIGPPASVCAEVPRPPQVVQGLFEKRFRAQDPRPAPRWWTCRAP